VARPQAETGWLAELTTPALCATPPFQGGEKGGAMDRIDEIYRAVGRIEGRLEEICKLPERVSKLEIWQSWLKGVWAVLAAAIASLGWEVYGK
jgi:hypothetical protein